MSNSTDHKRACVSVIVPCYCCRSTIGRAISSIAAQTLLPSEVIIVDDCSDEQTCAEIERLRIVYGPEWIRVIRQKRNLGPASARNCGWNSAQSDFIAFLDSDDSWHPQKIEIQYQWMREHTDVFLCGHLSLSIDASPNQYRFTVEALNVTEITPRALLVSNRFITPSIMLRRDIPLRFHDEKRYMEDHLLWMEICLLRMRVIRLEHVLCYTHKAAFGESGLSSHMWKMELGDLQNYRYLFRKDMISAQQLVFLSAYSLLKYIRRIFLKLFSLQPSSI
jgi:glycosyltransferase involved in cell wall biosynthesis